MKIEIKIYYPIKIWKDGWDVQKFKKRSYHTRTYTYTMMCMYTSRTRPEKLAVAVGYFWPATNTFFGKSFRSGRLD